ncbi:MAG: hypothetical protein HWN67_08510 [Candidatus Helarchaeota archaeon]|nr:hypothetical protein [Candidatus Helarchaeota archaeon]
MPNNIYDIIICDQCGRQSEPDMRFCTYCGAALTKNPLNFSSTSSSPSTSSESQAGNLLFQRLQSKTNEEPKQPSRVKQISKSPKTISSVAKMKRITRTKPQKPTTGTVSVVDSKLKLKLLEQLKDLNKLDRTLEASAIIRYRDHNVLAAATSTRTSENLMVTIASTIFDICSDSIKALGGGNIRILNITAEQITLLLSPINPDTVLIVVTNPKSNVGLISMYMEISCERIRNLLQIPA